MSDLRIREEKIKERRKSTSWRDFLKEIASYYNLTLYKKDGNNPTCMAPKFSGKGISYLDFEKIRENYVDYQQKYTGNFWQSYKEIFNQISFPYLAKRWDVENADFAHKVFYSSNAYLSFEICYSEKVVYSVNIKDNCSYIFNSIMIGDNSENIYNSVWVFKSFNVFYSRFIFDSADIWFCSHMVGCKECMFCDNLEHKSYCIQNKQYEKEEYMKLKKQILQEKAKFQTYFQTLPVTKNLLWCENTQGEYLMKSHNLEYGMFSYHIIKWKNTLFVWDAKWCENFYDVASAAYGKDYYGLVWGGLGTNYFCSIEIVWWSNIYYSYFLNDCSYCLGCIGLKNKSFCILNKQYSKEERFEKANEIFQQMESEWTLGQFFPWWMNPFYFNDTAAYLIDDSFTKEEVTAQWYLRRDDEIKVDIPAWADIIKTTELHNFQWYNENWERIINPEILKKVIIDSKWNYYKIVPMELMFLQKYGLPLPEIHWLDRIKLAFKF